MILPTRINVCHTVCAQIETQSKASLALLAMLEIAVAICFVFTRPICRQQPHISIELHYLETIYSLET